MFIPSFLLENVDMKKWSPFLVRVSKVPFFGTNFWQKVLIFICPKMVIWMPESKNEDHYIMPTFAQNYGKEIRFVHLALLKRFWANFSHLPMYVYLVEGTSTNVSNPIQGHIFKSA